MSRMVLAVSFLAAISVAVVAFLSDPFNLAGVYGSQGFIRSGEKFNISVGGSRSQATAMLRKKGINAVAPTSTFHGCFVNPVPPSQQIELFWDRSWRRGTICIASSKDTVTALGWHYNWLAP